MKITNRQIRLEKGQILPIMVIGMIVLIAFGALIIDGGSLMLNRRIAQAAADAGALAGARVSCYSLNEDPLAVAETYAFENGATTAIAEPLDNGHIKVTTSVANNSFFAPILIFFRDPSDPNTTDLNTDSATAEAEAGCFPPVGNYLMPFAWSCRPSVGGGETVFDEDKVCQMTALDWNNIQPLIEGPEDMVQIPEDSGDYYEMDGDSIVKDGTNLPPPQIYIIMDKIATNQDTWCKEDLSYCTTDPDGPNCEWYATAVTCDLDGDGKNDIQGAGNRGWLDLNDSGGGAAEMMSWIEHGLNFTIPKHIWLSGKPGTNTSVYFSIEDHRQGDIVLIPIFNAICDDRYPLSNQTCLDAAHADPFPPEPPGGDTSTSGQAPKFHVVTYNWFYISCVHSLPSDNCPGFALAQEKNPDPKNPKKSIIPDNTSSVEGFFLENYSKTSDTETVCDINLGNCVVTLYK